MRILTVGNFGRGWDGSICDEEHIAQALELFGHQVVRLQREELKDYGTPLGHFDFTLIAQWDGYPEHLELPKPLVYWAFDYQADGQAWHERLIALAELYLSKRIADSKYPNWRWLSQDFAPMFLHRYPDYHLTKKDIDILFTGSYLPWAKERNDTILALHLDHKVVIHSFNEWPKDWGLDVRPPIMDEGLPELYARARVVLSIDHTLEAGYWSDRTAQALACNSLVAMRYVPLMETRFIGGTIVPFYSVKDAVKQIDYLLKQPDSSLEIVREQGYMWSKRNLMVHHRASDLIQIVESTLL